MDTVLCLAPAGAGPSFFSSWLGGVNLVPLCLPGREGRFAEEPLASVPLLAESLLAAGRPSDRTVVFGHCFGAVVGYEFLRLLEAEGHHGDLALIASGSAAPGIHAGAAATGLPDAEFIATVRANAAYSHPAFDDPELAELLLPTLRADIAAYECYRPAWRAPAAFPITTIRGDRDALVSAADARAWGEVTSAEVRAFEVEGPHMYLVDRWPDVLEIIAKASAESGAR